MKDPHRISPFLKDCTPWKGSVLEQFAKNCSLQEGTILEKFMKDSIYGSHSKLEQRNSMKRKERQQQCYELTAARIPHPLCHSRGGGRGVTSEVEPGRKRVVEGRFL